MASLKVHTCLSRRVRSGAPACARRSRQWRAERRTPGGVRAPPAREAAAVLEPPPESRDREPRHARPPAPRRGVRGEHAPGLRAGCAPPDRHAAHLHFRQQQRSRHRLL